MLFHLIFITVLLIVAYFLGRALEKVMTDAEDLFENARNVRPELSAQLSGNGASRQERFLANLATYSSKSNETKPTINQS